MHNRSNRLILLFLSVLLLLGHFTNWAPPVTKATQLSVAHSDVPLPNFSHIFVIVMENKERGAIVGNHDAAYINQLAAQFGQANHFYGTTHPSLPNYLAMTGGDTFGITSDCTDCFVAADNLAIQLENGGRSWKAYVEGMPSPCFVGDAPPDYRQKHNPFIYYDNVRQNPTRCDHIVPFTQLAADLQANTLPDFVWISPNMCHSMHDCDIGTGDGGHRRHVAIRPVMGAHTVPHREQEGCVGVVVGFVDFVNQRWPGVGAGCVDAMALGAGGIENLLAGLRVPEQFRHDDADRRRWRLAPVDHNAVDGERGKRQRRRDHHVAHDHQPATCVAS